MRILKFYRRLFILNRQICAMDAQARWKFGTWLRRRYGEADRRFRSASSLLEAGGVPEDELGAQWTAQVEAQLVKLPRTLHEVSYCAPDGDVMQGRA